MSYRTLQQPVDLEDSCLRSGLQHPNILSLHGVCMEPLAMVVDFMPDGPLDSYLADASKRTFILFHVAVYAHSFHLQR